MAACVIRALSLRYGSVGPISRPVSDPSSPLLFRSLLLAHDEGQDYKVGCIG